MSPRPRDKYFAKCSFNSKALLSMMVCKMTELTSPFDEAMAIIPQARALTPTT